MAAFFAFFLIASASAGTHGVTDVVDVYEWKRISTSVTPCRSGGGSGDGVCVCGGGLGSVATDFQLVLVAIAKLIYIAPLRLARILFGGALRENIQER